MSNAGTQVMATTLPRPSRPSINPPPNAPLPALPVAKTRKSSTPGSPESPSSSMLPTAPAGARLRRNPSSATRFPVRPQLTTHAHSTSNIPTAHGSAAAAASSSPTTLASSDHQLPASAGAAPTSSLPATPAPKPLRKTISIGAFPQPPRTIPTPRSVTNSGMALPSPLSTSTTPDAAAVEARRDSGAWEGTRIAPPPRESSLKATRRHTGKRRAGSSASASKRPSLHGPASMVTGAAEGKTVSSEGLLRLPGMPSPPRSREPSPNGSCGTSTTTFEDMGGDVDRGAETRSLKSIKEKDGGKGNVVVSVRVRPEPPADMARAQQDWAVDGQQGSVTYKGREGGDYLYDNVFTGNDSNARVYDSTAKRLVRRVMEGYHGTVFAYGMTGTGKTFSMQGTAESLGIIPLAIADIFSFIRETPHREFLLRVSYLEIYNERILDLLVDPASAGAGAQEEIKLREDSKRGVYATPLKEEIVQSPNQLLRVIGRGDAMRKVGSTQWNLRSSRSHAVVQIVVESRERIPGNGSLQDSKRTAMQPGGVRVSTLSLIDLAGSEKAAEDKERQKEGKHINKSLLTLGTIIARLTENNKKPGGNHLPYRDSKLTRLLQPALSGNSLVSILCTIAVGVIGTLAAQGANTGETLNTLKFALRAKNSIVSHAKRAEESLAGGAGGDPGSRALLDRYRLEIDDLRAKLEEQTRSNREVREEEAAEEKAREREAEQHRREEQMLEMQLARTALKERIEHLNRLILSSRSAGVNATGGPRSYSSMSVHTTTRASVLSTMTKDGAAPPSASDYQAQVLSARSSSATSHAPAFDAPYPPPSATRLPPGSASTLVLSNNGSPRGSINTPNDPPVHHDHSLEADLDSFSPGAGGNDHTATSAAQIHALQSDLAERNRYIATLETRLHQARRASQSRLSAALMAATANSPHNHDSAAASPRTSDDVDQALRDKDAEIAELRARLDDKDRMLGALRDAARRREHLAKDVAASSVVVPPRNSSSSESAKSVEAPSSMSSAASVGGARAVVSRRGSSKGLARGGSGVRRGVGVEEVTRLVDEMMAGAPAGGTARVV